MGGEDKQMAHKKQKRGGGARPLRQGAPPDVKTIRTAIRKFLDTRVEGRKIGNANYGVYVFYDYDGEPIYVGQTYETLRSRIGRHLTNQRTDAVAMNVLDPFEVAEIAVWPLGKLGRKQARTILNRTEYTVFEKVTKESAFKAVLNEKDVLPARKIELPASYRARIIPDELYEGRKHPGVRIARRASTIASLARVISEREVSPGLRRTLVTQAKRLQKLASQRFSDFKGQVPTKPSAEEE
jgi:hypothetical protein